MRPSLEPRNGILKASSPSFVPIQGDPAFVVVGEFNGDGRADAVITTGSVSSNQAQVLFGIVFQAGISPVNGSGDSQVFTLSYTDPAGFTNLNSVF